MAQGIVSSTMGTGGLIGSILVSAVLALSGAPEVRWPFWLAAAAISLAGAAVALDPRPGLLPIPAGPGRGARRTAAPASAPAGNVVTRRPPPVRLESVRAGRAPVAAAAGMDIEEPRP